MRLNFQSMFFTCSPQLAVTEKCHSFNQISLARNFVPKPTKAHHEACSHSLAPPHLATAFSEQLLMGHSCCWPETQPFFPLSHPQLKIWGARGDLIRCMPKLTANGHTASSSYFREPGQILQNHSKDDFCTKHHRMVTH